MKSKKLKMIIKAALIMFAISSAPFFENTTTADSISNLEEQFLSVTEGYGSEEVVVENGVSLKFGETLNLSKYKNAKMSNSDIVSISNTGVVTPKKEGTVYLSKKIGNKVHVIEIYVSNSKSFYSSNSPKEVDRSYYKVFIDPGHGGNDDGSSAFGLKEDELNLKIGLKIQKKLEEKGIEVKMSRTSDIYLSLDERAEMANQYGADIFVSNHINSFEKESAYGMETYYHKDKIAHKPLSDDIQDNGIKETGAFNRGVKNANFAVLRESEMPSSLFEAGFISNKEESNKLRDEKYQEKLAKAVADGVEKYLKDNIKLNGNNSTPEVKPEDKPIEKPTEKPDTSIKTGTVTASALNVRSEASTSSSIKGSLSRGSKVEIVSTSKGWHKIKYKGSYGYISADYVKINDSSSSSNNSSSNNNSSNNKPESTVKTGTVTASALNVRSEASTSSSIKGSLSRGSKVEIVSTSKGWHKIKYKGSYGYVSADYVKINDSSSNSNNSSSNNNSSNNKPESTVKTGTVTASALNVRSGASTSSSIKGSLSRGSKVEIVSTSKGWHKIKYKGSYGYVSADYVKI